jgi:hypothetical protein
MATRSRPNVQMATSMTTARSNRAGRETCATAQTNLAPSCDHEFYCRPRSKKATIRQFSAAASKPLKRQESGKSRNSVLDDLRQFAALHQGSIEQKRRFHLSRLSCATASIAAVHTCGSVLIQKLREWYQGSIASFAVTKYKTGSCIFRDPGCISSRHPALESLEQISRREIDG